jgi:hypothetical protein
VVYVFSTEGDKGEEEDFAVDAVEVQGSVLIGMQALLATVVEHHLYRLFNIIHHHARHDLLHQPERTLD